MPAVEKKVGVAVIGTGFVGGQAHVPSFRKIPGSELVALGARTEKRVAKLAKKYEVKYYLDYKELIRDPKVDALVIATPTPFHFPVALEALKNGKHVLCEMPVAPKLSEVEELKKEAEKAGVVFMPVLNFRFTPNYVKAKALIDEGAVGKVVAASFKESIGAKVLAAQWPADSWAWDAKMSGGYPDFTLSVWSIDLLRWLFDAEYEAVEWKSNYTPLREEYGGIIGYNTMGLVKLSNGVVASLHYSCTVTPAETSSRLEIYGDNTCSLYAEGNDKLILVGEEPTRREWRFQEPGPRVWGHYQLDEHFIKCILGEEKPKITMDDAIKAQEVASRMVK
ncbi:MAG: Gfo/Idh/MocA family oxidoreductase [Candidatus Bathyarchaeia archaeon]|nr:Gfo/Idh/MocA family oxidoreductase [Candidatus Bathyarchaeota archaeon]